ncbi:MAG: UDP-N-acetylmuramate dehydrogenase [Oscillospiraceae bacterium]|nr:UDP-N-acetylmuramate dehydrogenase [Oscillospiraceae bacterium]
MFAERAASALPGLSIKTEEPLREHTSFRIGGGAAVMVFPKNETELSVCRKLLSEMEIEPLILGAGTNVLAPDEGLQRVVLCLKGALCGIRAVGDTQIEAWAGEQLSRTALFARDHGLSGLEFAHGIPGTVGGGVYMNAGAYGGELKQVVTEVTVMDKMGELRTVPCGGETFGYRTSIFEDCGDIIVKATFSLQPGDPKAIGETMRELMERRKASQPLELPSAGSTFKRPKTGYAAAMIDEAGLKGTRVGGAAVSEKHAGFVVNLGGATAADVKALMKQIQETVEKNNGIRLEPEVRIW